jgi:hypothetical protein
MEGKNNNSTPKIFVYYQGDSNVKDSEVAEKLTSLFTDGSVCVVIPTIGQSRLECINPVYITDIELIKKHSLLLEELHEHIRFRLENKG